MRQLATTSSDKTIKLWNLDGFSLDRTLTGKALSCLSLSKLRLQAWSLQLCQPHLHARSCGRMCHRVRTIKQCKE